MKARVELDTNSTRDNMENKETVTKEIYELANLLKVLSEPNRLLLLNKIIEGVQCNCELGESLSMSPNLVSHHIAILCESGLIKAEKDKNDARWIYYSVNNAVMNKLKTSFFAFFDETRIKACLSSCGPRIKGKAN